LLIRTLKGVIHTLAGILAGAAIVLLALAWLLSRGPVSLGFMAPYIGDLINDALPSVEAEFDDTILTWAGWERAVDLRVINLRVRAQEGSVLAQVPEVAFSISTKALVRGVIAPARVELFGPTLYAVRETDGHLNIALAGAGAVATGQLEPFLEQLSEASDPDDPLSYLTHIDISDADLVIEDSGRGRSWVTPDTQISLRRDGGRLEVETSFLVDLGDSIADVSLVGAYDVDTRRIDAGLSFGGVRLSALADAAPQIKFLEFLDVPVQGTITIASSVDGVLESVGFDLSGEGGQFHLPAPFNETLKTEDLSLRGNFDATREFLEIREFRAVFAAGTSFVVPAPINHAFPLSRIGLVGAYDGSLDTVDVQSLALDSNNVSVYGAGVITDLSSAAHIAMGLDVSEIRVEEFATYWPPTVLDDAYNWVSTQVSAGVVSDIRVELEGAVQESGDFEMTRADGEFRVHDAVIRYVDSLPQISDVSGTSRFDMDRIDFNVERAHSFGMDLETGSISLIDISGNTERAEIRAVATGPFKKAMEMIDGEPLNFTEELEIDPATVRGVIRADLAFDFPLIETLQWEQVKASADAELEAVSIPGGLFGLDVDAGRLELSMDNQGMSVGGELLLQNFPTVLNWQQNFDTSTPFKNRYDIASHVTDVQNITDLGIDVAPFSADMIRGEIPVNVHVVEAHNGHVTLEGRASLDGVLLSFPAINWWKEDGVPGEATVSIEMQGDEVTAIPAFAVKADDLVVEGAAHYSADSHTLNRIELSRIKYGRTDMTGLLVPGAGKSWDANFTGPSLDLDPVWDDIVYGDFTESGQTLLSDVSLSAQFDRVWLEDDRGLDNLVAAFAREDEIWKTIYITSQVKNGAPLEVKMTPSEKSNGRILTVWSSDAGEALRTFDLYDLMVGGELSLTGMVDDSKDNHPFSGNLGVRHYRIVEAPTLAKLVSLMSLTGIVESLQGEGLAFETLTMPIAYADGILQLTDAKATGASLGFTASGVVYTHADMVDVTGTVVPAYALNSALGNIPLIGNIFSGGEEGSGIFAANYTMTGSRSDPEVSVNPLSVLAPGFLRNIFGIFDDGESLPAESVDPDKSRDK